MGNNTRLFDDMIAAQAKLKVSSEAITTAQNTFTTEFNTFLSYSTVLEMQFKELEQRELKVAEREKAVEEREKKCAVIEQREQEVTEKERKWILTDQRMKENAAKLPTVIRFNICGSKFAISKEKLLEYKGSLFEDMIVTDIPQQLPSNEIFIERDPTYFPLVVRFIVAGVHPLLSSLSTKERDAIFKEFDYFRIPFHFFSQCDTVSNTLVDEINYGNTIIKWLPNHKFQLIYKASIDGFKAQDFHKLCNNKGPTLTVICSSGGYLFGGYSPISWDSTNKYKTSTDAFIFTLHNPHNIPPTKYTVSDANRAIYCYADSGPCFGGVHDIGVSDDANKKDVNYTYFPYSYNDTTGKGNKTFTGAYEYTASEIEVFVVL